MIATLFSLIVVVLVVAPGFAAIQIRDWFTLCLRRSDFERTLYAVLYGTSGLWLASLIIPPFRELLAAGATHLSTGGDDGTLVGQLASPVLMVYFAVVLFICALIGFSHAGIWHSLRGGGLVRLLPRTAYTRVWDEFWYMYLASQEGPAWVEIMTRSGQHIVARVGKVADYPGERDLLLREVYKLEVDRNGKQRLVAHTCPAWWLPAESVEWIGYHQETDESGRAKALTFRRPPWLLWSHFAGAAVVLIMIVAVVLHLIWPRKSGHFVRQPWQWTAARTQRG